MYEVVTVVVNELVAVTDSDEVADDVAVDVMEVVMVDVWVVGHVLHRYGHFAARSKPNGLSSQPNPSWANCIHFSSSSKP